MASVLSLTQPDLDFGKRLGAVLREVKFPYQGLFWLYDDERDDWQLVIATSRVDEIGPRGTYLELSQATSKAGGNGFQLTRVTVMSPEDPLYKALRSVFGSTASVEGARLRYTTVNGIVVPEAYLYEIR